MKRFVYADNAATTKLDSDAFETMKKVLIEEYGNASQPYSLSRNPKQTIKTAREIIAECINASPDEIFFTSCGTESDNWAIKGIAFSSKGKKAIITSEIEHSAILKSCQYIEKLGYPVKYLPVTSEGVVTAEALENAITDHTALVSIMYANNEIGTMQPIKSLCKIAHEHGSLFHTDAVQAVGHVHIDVKDLGVDMLSASAHKFNGPKGMGFLYLKKGTSIDSYISGGEQEHGMRAGTENAASAIGMAIALRNNVKEIDHTINHLHYLESVLISGLQNANIDFVRNGANQVPGNISLSFRGQDGETLLHRLDLKGISVSTGSACNGKSTELSSVLKSIRLSPEYAHGTIRISLSKDNSQDEVIYIVEEIKKIISKKIYNNDSVSL